MTVLVTGFGPFLDVTKNPSGDVLALLGRHISTMLLPVEYDLASRLLCERLVVDRPDSVILLGLAGQESLLRLETLARNRDAESSPDNAGQVHDGVPVVPGAPDVYPSTLPTARLEAALSRAGFVATTSIDAGGYVCNHVFFQARHLIEERGLSIRCGLIHVQSLDAAAGWTLGRLATAVNYCVEVATAEA